MFTGCATFFQAEDLKKNQEETTRKVQEIIDITQRGTCTMQLCGDEIVVNSATKKECQNLHFLLQNIEARTDLCDRRKNKSNETPINSRYPLASN